MLLTVRSAASYDLAGETFAVLMIEPPPHSRTHQVRQERLVTTPTLSCVLRHDLYGNPQRHMLLAPGRFSVTFTATIETAPNLAVAPGAVEHPPQDMPAEALIYTLPSRYCESDELAEMAQEEFGHLSPGGRRVLDVAEWVRRNVT